MNHNMYQMYPMYSPMMSPCQMQHTGSPYQMHGMMPMNGMMPMMMPFPMSYGMAPINPMYSYMMMDPFGVNPSSMPEIAKNDVL